MVSCAYVAACDGGGGGDGGSGRIGKFGSLECLGNDNFRMHHAHNESEFLLCV